MSHSDVELIPPNGKLMGGRSGGLVALRGGHMRRSVDLGKTYIFTVKL